MNVTFFLSCFPIHLMQYFNYIKRKGKKGTNKTLCEYEIIIFSIFFFFFSFNLPYMYSETLCGATLWQMRHHPFKILWNLDIYSALTGISDIQMSCIVSLFIYRPTLFHKRSTGGRWICITINRSNFWS